MAILSWVFQYDCICSVQHALNKPPDSSTHIEKMNYFDVWPCYWEWINGGCKTKTADFLRRVFHLTRHMCHRQVQKTVQWSSAAWRAWQDDASNWNASTLLVGCDSVIHTALAWLCKRTRDLILSYVGTLTRAAGKPRKPNTWTLPRLCYGPDREVFKILTTIEGPWNMNESCNSPCISPSKILWGFVVIVEAKRGFSVEILQKIIFTFPVRIPENCNPTRISHTFVVIVVAKSNWICK